MKRENDPNRELFRVYRLPELPEGQVVDRRYSIVGECWYAKVDDQWYWLDVRQGVTAEWKPSAYDPNW